MFKYIVFLRPHHWIKNFLLFIPIIASQQLTQTTLTKGVLGFVAFCLIASSGYIINDIFDVKNDQSNFYKKNRPFASGEIIKSKSIFLIFILITFAGLISIKLNIEFFYTILIYFVFTILYSLILKKIFILDLLILSSFFYLRIFAGSKATDIFISSWLLYFSIFFFFALSSVKRLAELSYLYKNNKTKIKGRAYDVSNIPLVKNISYISAYISIIILFLYVNSPEIIILYSSPTFLWGICLVLLYWITKIILFAKTGQMHQDPIVFAIKNKLSYICLILIIMLLIAGILI